MNKNKWSTKTIHYSFISFYFLFLIIFLVHNVHWCCEWNWIFGRFWLWEPKICRLVFLNFKFIQTDAKTFVFYVQSLIVTMENICYGVERMLKIQRFGNYLLKCCMLWIVRAKLHNLVALFSHRTKKGNFIILNK